MSDDHESELDLENEDPNEPESGSESIVEDDNDEEEIVDQDDNEEEEEGIKPAAVIDKATVPSEIKQKEAQPKSKEPIVAKQKAKVSPLANKREQPKMRNIINSDVNGNTKSIFSRITESLFDSYLNTTENYKPKAYDMLISENYVSKIKEQDNKENKEKFNDMLDRQYKYLETVNSKRKQRQEQQQEDLKSKCTWTPNGIKKDKKEVRNAADFYTDQMKFIEEKANGIKKKKDDIDTKIVSDMTAVPNISQNSKRIAESKQAKESNTEFVTRLQNQALRTAKNKLITEDAEKANKKTRTKTEINELVTKLHGENEKLKSNIHEKQQKKIEDESKRNKELITESTKKILFDKLINSYERALLELFNRKDNFPINLEAYCSLMIKMGFIKSQNAVNENQEHGLTVEADQQLVRETFDNYLSPYEERIQTHFCLIFFLVIIGIYKGKGYTDEEPIPEQENNANALKKKEEADAKPIKKKKTPEEFIHTYLPELNLEQYQYPIKVIKGIKKKYQCLFDNISFTWEQEANEKRKEKKLKYGSTTSNLNNTHDKYNNGELKAVSKNATLKASSRNKIIDKATSDIEDPNMSARQLKIEEIYGLLQKKKEKELVSLRSIKEKENMKECTFQPNSATKKVNKDIGANIEKLYTDGKITYVKKLQSEDHKKVSEAKELEKCTFKPIIHTVNEMIKNNPLDNDSHLKKEMERREQGRIDRDMLTTQKKKGMTYTGFSNINASDNRHADTMPSMRFDNEKRTYKDTFKNFDARNKANTFTSSNDTKRNVKERQPLLNIEVNIDDNNQIVKLEIFPGDDPINIAEDFCAKHGLSNDKKEKLQRIIQEKLNEATCAENNNSQSQS